MLKIGVITMALLSFLNAGWFASLFDSTPTPPISLPIDLSKAGSVVETEMRIKDKWHYLLILDFMYIDPKVDRGIDINKVQKFIGFNAYDHSGKQFVHGTYEQAKRNLGNLIDENYNLDGTVVPIKITIHQINQDNTKKLVIDKLYITKGQGTSTSLYRDFGAIFLTEGKYAIRVENIQASSEMSGRKVNFTIRINKRVK